MLSTGMLCSIQWQCVLELGFRLLLGALALVQLQPQPHHTRFPKPALIVVKRQGWDWVVLWFESCSRRVINEKWKCRLSACVSWSFICVTTVVFHPVVQFFNGSSSGSSGLTSRWIESELGSHYFILYRFNTRLALNTRLTQELIPS